MGTCNGHGDTRIQSGSESKISRRTNSRPVRFLSTMPYTSLLPRCPSSIAECTDLLILAMRHINVHTGATEGVAERNQYILFSQFLYIFTCFHLVGDLSDNPSTRNGIQKAIIRFMRFVRRTGHGTFVRSNGKLYNSISLSAVVLSPNNKCADTSGFHCPILVSLQIYVYGSCIDTWFDPS